MDEKNYTISDEELNTILLSSPLTLPDSPSISFLSEEKSMLYLCPDFDDFVFRLWSLCEESMF